MILLFRFGDLHHRMYILEKSKSSQSWPSTSFISLRDKSLFIAGGGRGGGGEGRGCCILIKPLSLVLY